MTTFSFRATTVTTNARGVATAVKSSVVSITVTWAYLDLYPVGSDFEVMSNQAMNLRIDGKLISRAGLGFEPLAPRAEDQGVHVFNVEWGSKSATVMSIGTGRKTTTFEIDGDALPALTTVAAVRGFWNDSLTVKEFDWEAGTESNAGLVEWENLLLPAATSIGGVSENDVYVEQRGIVNGTMRWRAGDDRHTGGAGNETIYGGEGNDSLFGGAGNDMLYGDEGNDRLDGGVGFDTIYGGDGADLIYGGTHRDLLYGDAGNDKLFGDSGRDELYGGAGNDTLDGGAGNDLLRGDEGNDRLLGKAGRDVLYGGDGNDTLDGGTGNDALFGGLGADTFNFAGKSGRDTILDFNVAEGDILRISAATAGVARATSTTKLIEDFATDLGDAVRFDFGNGNAITLLGIATPEDLSGSIVLF